MASPRPALVGGFVLGGVVLVVVSILFFGGRDVFSARTPAVVYFKGAVDGLGPGALVTFRGVRVGTVARVALVIDPGVMQARIPVYLSLEPNRVIMASGSTGKPMLRQLIAAGLRAQLESQSLVTGEMRVELDFHPETPAVLQAGAPPDPPQIPSITSDLQQLRAQLTRAPIAETITQLRQTLAAVQTLATHVDTVLGPLSGDARGALGEASATLAAASSAIAELRRDGGATLGEVGGLAADGRAQLRVRAEQLGATLAAAERTLRALDALASSAGSLVARGSRPRGDLEAMLRDLAASAGALRELTQAVERDPSIVLRGRRVP